MEELRSKLDQYTREVHQEMGQPVVFHGADTREHMEEMYALPFSTHRDANTLTRSNWRVIHEDLTGRFPDSVESHSFGHWAVGWVERLYVRRDADEAIAAAGEWIDTLESSGIADKSDLSELESDEITASWRQYLNLDMPGEIEDRHGEWVRQAWDDMTGEDNEAMFWHVVSTLEIYPEHDGLDVLWSDHMNAIVDEIANRIRPSWSVRCMMKARNDLDRETRRIRYAEYLRRVKVV